MTEYVETHSLKVDRSLHDFIAEEALPGTGVEADRFWSGFSAMVHDLAPKNRQLLSRRKELQAEIDAWHKENGAPADLAAYEGFLRSIGYLLPEGRPFSVTTENVDPEIARIAGPQLVVPVMNARYALNAANARWGSLYDALYGTDAIAEEGGAARGPGYNPRRGAKVVRFCRDLLDEAAPLADGSHVDSTAYAVADGRLSVKLADGRTTGLADPARFRGFRGEASSPEAVLLVNNNLHLEIVVAPAHLTLGACLQRGVAAVIEPVGAFFSGIADLGRLREENVALQQELRELRERQVSLADLSRENAELRELLGMQQRLEHTTTAGRVIAQPPGQFRWSVLLDIGAAQGVEENMAVINADGLVGKVTDVSDRHARVQLAISPNAGYFVRVVETRQHGLLSGRGSRPMQLRIIDDPEAEIPPEAEVVTRAFEGTSIPDGVPVGVVDDSSAGEIGGAQFLGVRPYVDFTRLDIVLVVLDAPQVPEGLFDEGPPEPPPDEDLEEAPDGDADEGPEEDGDGPSAVGRTGAP